MKSSLKFLPLLLCLLMVVAACGDSKKSLGGSGAGQDIKLEPGQGTAIQFSHLTMKFGPVMSGDTVKAVYPFKNVSNTTQVIQDVIVSCPCMMPSYPKTNIQPGQVGEIKVNFATHGQFGTHEKIIAVLLEGNPEPISLHLNGQINKAE
jgi:hypothetical protein